MTSITMNGGTSLRTEGTIGRFVTLNMQDHLVAAAHSRPDVAAFLRTFGALTSRNHT
jgi:hypothetical protein